MKNNILEIVKPTQDQSRFIAFFDECGDHSMNNIDKDFPLFVLSTVIFDRKKYTKQTISELAELKLKFWNHEGINLHSRDIRKQLDDFSFTRVPNHRQHFIEELTAMMKKLEFTLFITVINKNSHKAKYGTVAENPYDLALIYSFERILHFLEANNEIDLPITAEARGRNEDNELASTFYRLMNQGTAFNVAKRFKKLNCQLTFRRKSDNIAGMQIADLCAYPAARHILYPDQKNLSFDVVSQKIYNSGKVSGLKVFP
jgi:hypothetical protein